jgi:hypothetical protein
VISQLKIRYHGVPKCLQIWPLPADSPQSISQPLSHVLPTFCQLIGAMPLKGTSSSIS